MFLVGFAALASYVMVSLIGWTTLLLAGAGGLALAHWLGWLVGDDR